MRSKPSRISGIGIDIVDLDRAARFVRDHGGRLDRFLLPHEYRRFRRSRSRAAAFALYFAAKEAVSKALGQSIQVPAEFRRYSVHVEGSRWHARAALPSGKKARFCLRPFRLEGSIGVLAFAQPVR